MNINECFSILGIDKTEDEQIIKNAYREKLAITSPEDNPEGFKKLRAAYETILKNLKRRNDSNDEEEDTSPIDLWINRVDKIYHSFSKRIDITCWEELFKDEIFDAIDDEEIIREKFLIFLMKHFRLPYEVWLLIDEKVEISNNEEKFRSSFPGEFVDYVLRCIRNGSSIEYEDFEGADDADYDTFLNLYYNAWEKCDLKEFDEALEIISQCEKLGIYHPGLGVLKIFTNAKGEGSAAVGPMEELYSKYPDNLTVQYQTAESLWGNDLKEKAVNIYKIIVENDKKHYPAMRKLAEYYYETGDCEKAKEYAEGVRESFTDDEFGELLININNKLEQKYLDEWKNGNWESALELCWNYFHKDEVIKALKLAGKIEKNVSKEKIGEYYDLLSGLRFALGDFEVASEYALKSLEYFKQKISFASEDDKKHFERRISHAYIIIFKSYTYLSICEAEYKKKIFNLYIDIKDSIKRDVHLRLDIAQSMIYLREYNIAIGIGTELYKSFGVCEGAYYAMLGYQGVRNVRGTINYASICIQTMPEFTEPYGCLAKTYFQTERYDELYDLKYVADENNVNSMNLEAYVYLAENNMKPKNEYEIDEYVKKFYDDIICGIGNGNTHIDQEATIEEAKKYCKWCPENYMYAHIANLYLNCVKLDEALDVLSDILLRTNSYGWPYRIMSAVFAYKNHEKALYYRKLALLTGYDELDSISDCEFIVRQYLSLSEYEEAIKWCQKATEISEEKEGKKYISSYIIDVYVRMGDKEKAYSYLDQYVDLNFKNDKGQITPAGYNKICSVLKDMGDYELIKNKLEKYKSIAVDSKKFKTDDKIVEPQYYDNLGWYYLGIGDYKNAREAFITANSFLKSETASDNEIIGLKGLLYAAILYSDRDTWEEHSKYFRCWMEQRAKSVCFEEYNEPKKWMYYKLISNFYNYSKDELLQMIEEANNDLYCRCCTCPFCMELDALVCLAHLHAGEYNVVHDKLDRVFSEMPNEAFYRPIQIRLDTLKNKGKKKSK